MFRAWRSPCIPDLLSKLYLHETSGLCHATSISFVLALPTSLKHQMASRETQLYEGLCKFEWMEPDKKSSMLWEAFQIQVSLC